MPHSISLKSAARNLRDWAKANLGTEIRSSQAHEALARALGLRNAHVAASFGRTLTLHDSGLTQNQFEVTFKRQVWAYSAIQAALLMHDHLRGHDIPTDLSVRHASGALDAIELVCPLSDGLDDADRTTVLKARTPMGNLQWFEVSFTTTQYATDAMNAALLARGALLKKAGYSDRLEARLAYHPVGQLPPPVYAVRDSTNSSTEVDVQRLDTAEPGIFGPEDTSTMPVAAVVALDPDGDGDFPDHLKLYCDIRLWLASLSDADRQDFRRDVDLQRGLAFWGQEIAVFYQAAGHPQARDIVWENDDSSDITVHTSIEATDAYLASLTRHA